MSRAYTARELSRRLVSGLLQSTAGSEFDFSSIIGFVYARANVNCICRTMKCSSDARCSHAKFEFQWLVNHDASREAFKLVDVEVPNKNPPLTLLVYVFAVMEERI